MNDLIARIDDAIPEYSHFLHHDDLRQLIHDCRTELQRLLTDNDSLRNLNDSLDAECARLEQAREYAPSLEDKLAAAPKEIKT